MIWSVLNSRRVAAISGKYHVPYSLSERRIADTSVSLTSDTKITPVRAGRPTSRLQREPSRCVGIVRAAGRMRTGQKTTHECGLVSGRRLQGQSREFRHKSGQYKVPQHQGVVPRIPQRAHGLRGRQGERQRCQSPSQPRLSTPQAFGDLVWRNVYTP